MIVRGSPKRVTLIKFTGLLRYQKPHVTDYIAFAYNVQCADSLYCCVYSTVSYNKLFALCLKIIFNVKFSIVETLVIIY